MQQISKQQIESAIAQYQETFLAQDLISAKALKSVIIKDTSIQIEICLGFPAQRYQQQLSKDLHELLADITQGYDLQIKIDWKINAHVAQAAQRGMAQIKNIVAVASAKGGVGKSTTTVNLALALAAEGAKVGILDADIYGPSQPMMLGISGAPESHDNKTIEPLEKYGVQSMSIGYLVDQEAAVAWRGPMVSRALQQLLNDTNWQDLDYLFIDMPPGTGDIQLTLAQKVPLSGAIVVTTPQDIALLDARRGVSLFNKVKVPVLGIVENMATHICSACGHQEAIFGEGGGQRLAQESNETLLGQLPLALQIREETDAGKPTVVADPDGAISGEYLAIARKVAAKLALQTKNYSHKFPNIVVE